VEKQIKIEIENGNYVVTKVKPLITSALGYKYLLHPPQNSSEIKI
jgi:hypothetical protein